MLKVKPLEGSETKLWLKKSCLFLASAITVISLISCGSSSGTTEVEGPVIDTPIEDTPVVEEQAEEEIFEDLYDLNTIVRVDIEMPEDDWSSLAAESRFGGGGFGGGFGGGGGAPAACFAYNYYYGDVTVNGETLENVAVRKKGGYGSSDNVNPGLKVNFDKGEGNDGRKFEGDKRMTLNNNKQDASLIKQCLAYSIFTEAGVRAPRCNFADVSAQGRSLGQYGVYTHVEPVKKPFLERVFGDKSGNLYETQRDGAFLESRIAHFQAKTNEDETDRSELMAVVDAMKVDTEELWAAMDKVINLDNFMTFVAMEAMLGHGDGFTGYQNNVLIYHNPEDSRLYFIPWGADQTFYASYLLDRRNDSPASIMLGSSLIQRMWESEEFRTRYDARIVELLNTVWDEATLHARADQMAAIANADPDEVELVHEFIDGRRAKIEAELAGEADRLGNWSLLGPASGAPEVCDD